MNLIFDLDGTLIDSRTRLYNLFQHLVPESRLSYESYWAFKLEKISNETILAKEFGFDTVAIAGFVGEWMDRIEAPELLELDTEIPGMRKALGSLRKKARLHVCTSRQQSQSVFDQLDRLGLLSFFESVMVTEQKHSKEELIAVISDLSYQDWIIGDTGKDIKVGKALGLRTCAVLTGFLSERKLRAYGPELILATAAEFSI